MGLLDKLRQRRTPELQEWRDPDEAHPDVEKWFRTPDAYGYIQKKEVLRGTMMDTSHILGESDLTYATKIVYQPHVMFQGPKKGNTALTIDLVEFDSLEEALQGTEAWYQGFAKRSLFSSRSPKTAVTQFLEATDAIDADKENDEETKQKTILASLGLLPVKTMALIPNRWQKTTEVRTPNEAWTYHNWEDRAEVWRFLNDEFYAEVRSNQWDTQDTWSFCIRPLDRDDDDHLVETIVRGFPSEIEAMEYVDQFFEGYRRCIDAGFSRKDSREGAAYYLDLYRSHKLLDSALENIDFGDEENSQEKVETGPMFG